VHHVAVGAAAEGQVKLAAETAEIGESVVLAIVEDAADFADFHGGRSRGKEGWERKGKEEDWAHRREMANGE
jgi:hypothetical protein